MRRSGERGFSVAEVDQRVSNGTQQLGGALLEAWCFGVRIGTGDVVDGHVAPVDGGTRQAVTHVERRTLATMSSAVAGTVGHMTRAPCFTLTALHTNPTSLNEYTH
ncbi:hypothetical protein ERJ75_000405100 [Trypanosoma vivax]|nr:hypothetical protein ERJ75_000405100 [Trypanosoma vivax]